MEENYKGFFKQSSPPQYLFKYDSVRNDYVFLKGQLRFNYIGDLIPEYKDELIEFLEDLYDDENTTYHTKRILKDIVKIHKLKK